MESCLRVDPLQRPTMSHVVGQLEQYFSGLPVTGHRYSVKGRTALVIRRKPAWLVAAAFSALALVRQCWSGVRYAERRAERPPRRPGRKPTERVQEPTAARADAERWRADAERWRADGQAARADAERAVRGEMQTALQGEIDHLEQEGGKANGTIKRSSASGERQRGEAEGDRRRESQRSVRRPPSSSEILEEMKDDLGDSQALRSPTSKDSSPGIARCRCAGSRRDERPGRRRPCTFGRRRSRCTPTSSGTVDAGVRLAVRIDELVDAGLAARCDQRAVDNHGRAAPRRPTLRVALAQLLAAIDADAPTIDTGDAQRDASARKQLSDLRQALTQLSSCSLLREMIDEHRRYIRAPGDVAAHRPRRRCGCPGRDGVAPALLPRSSRGDRP